LALAVASAGAVGRFGTNPRALIERGAKLLSSGADLGQLGPLGQPLAAAGRAAASRGIDSISDRIRQRADALRAPQTRDEEDEDDEREDGLEDEQDRADEEDHADEGEPRDDEREDGLEDEQDRADEEDHADEGEPSDDEGERGDDMDEPGDDEYESAPRARRPRSTPAARSRRRTADDQEPSRREPARDREAGRGRRPGSERQPGRERQPLRGGSRTASGTGAPVRRRKGADES
jgi:hypothetical protein